MDCPRTFVKMKAEQGLIDTHFKELGDKHSREQIYALQVMPLCNACMHLMTPNLVVVSTSVFMEESCSEIWALST